jgi:SAM-dependent methyltransferase
MKNIIRKLFTSIGSKVQEAPAQSADDWNRHFQDEAFAADHWLNKVKERCSSGYPISEFVDPQLREVLSQCLDQKDTGQKVLDLGAGPITHLIENCDISSLEIYAVDPLADDYNRMLDQYNIQPPVRTRKGDGAKLVEAFGENFFDLTYSRNAVDHSIDPLKCIDEMIKVTKPGCFIVMQAYEREGESQNWTGLHQWNLFIARDQEPSGKDTLFLQGRKSEGVDLIKMFEDRIALIQLIQDNSLITAVFQTK